MPRPDRHFLELSSVPAPELHAILVAARGMKAAIPADAPRGFTHGEAPLENCVVALIFERPSTRTRVSFEVAVHQLGGTPIVLSAADMQSGRGESVADTARVLSRYADAAVIRARRHADLEAWAQAAHIPVVNGLTERAHPCQLIADMLTIEERCGGLSGKVVAWLGDYNNVARSLAAAAEAFDFKVRFACPRDLVPELPRAARFKHFDRASDAVCGVDVVMTDTWVSMGDEVEQDARRARFRDFQVSGALMAKAGQDAIFMHCLPAHRGEEVASVVIDGPQSVVWDQAENRVHAQKAILRWCLCR